MCGSFIQPGDINILESFGARFGVEVSDDPGDADPTIRQELKATPFREVDPAAIIAEVHNRMPFVMADEDVKTWLDPEITEFDKLMDLIRPISSKDLERSPEV
ncbi:MAG: SOS response-associated peptidase family protein [Thermoleophilia bacterium]